MVEIESGHAVSGIVLRDGPSGSRAGLVAGPDVWEVIAVWRDFDGHDAVTIGTVASELDLTPAAVQEALAYYDAFTAEIDERIVANERAAEDALRAWQSER